jgi:hypothetical protein
MRFPLRMSCLGPLTLAGPTAGRSARPVLARVPQALQAARLRLASRVAQDRPTPRTPSATTRRASLTRSERRVQGVYQGCTRDAQGAGACASLVHPWYTPCTRHEATVIGLGRRRTGPAAPLGPVLCQNGAGAFRVEVAGTAG